MAVNDIGDVFDLILHVLLALFAQAVGALIGYLFGFMLGAFIGHVLVFAIAGSFLGACGAGAGITKFLQLREMDQARDRQIADGGELTPEAIWGRTKHIEWRVPMYFCITGAGAFPFIVWLIVR